MQNKTRQHARRQLVVTGVALMLGASACGEVAGTANQVIRQEAVSAKQTITFADDASNGPQPALARLIHRFEQIHPNIAVRISTLPPSTSALEHLLEHRPGTATSAPDVFVASGGEVASLAGAGLLAGLGPLHPDSTPLLRATVSSGQFHKRTYAVPWGVQLEGLLYRTDLVSGPPTSPAEVISDAKAAMRRDHSLREGIAFSGSTSEDTVNGWATISSAFGGGFTPSRMDSPGNITALKWLQDSIYTDKVAASSVTSWRNSQVVQEFTSGHAAFAIADTDLASITVRGAPSKERTGFIAFPATPGNSPGVLLSVETLAISAKSVHAPAAWELISYLTSPSVEITRAMTAGDLPAASAAYTAWLLAREPLLKTMKNEIDAAVVNPPIASSGLVRARLESALAKTLANETSASAALRAVGYEITSLTGGR